MNLELLNPFGRSVPDRIDSTLSLAPALHYFTDAPPLQPTLQPPSTTHEEVIAAESDPATTHTTSTNTTTMDRKAKQRAAAAVARHGKTRKKRTNTSHSTLDDLLLSQDDQEYRAAYHLIFNRRGSFVACGYGSGTVAVFSFASRTLMALYSSQSHGHGGTIVSQDKRDYDTAAAAAGITSVSWSRQSRTLLSASVGEARVKLWDNEHVFGRHQAWIGLARQRQIKQQQQQQQTAKPSDDTKQPAELEHPLAASPPPEAATPTVPGSRTSGVFAANAQYTYAREQRHIPHQMVELGTAIPATVQQLLLLWSHATTTQRQQQQHFLKKKHPCVSFDFPMPVGGPVQICPRCASGGLAVLCDGSLVLFWLPKSAFCSQEKMAAELKEQVAADGVHESSQEQMNGAMEDLERDTTVDEDDSIPPTAIIIPLWKEGGSGSITCASFDHHGDRVFAATKGGMLLGFNVAPIWKILLRPEPTIEPPQPPATFDSEGHANPTNAPDASLPNTTPTLPHVSCHFKISLGGSTAWHLLVSRNGKYLVVNSADGALRLFSTADLWEQPATYDKKPTWMFQDMVSKVKFVCCDLSGMDGEFLVGGANGDDNKYELYIWNTTTGALMDKLTGSPVQLYSVAWHPTRAFIAVATSDGLIDVWGPKMDWTAFAPDFQMLPANVEYVEEQDEFDVDAEGMFVSEANVNALARDQESEIVDVLSIEKVPAFGSDSESETYVFNFEMTLCSDPSLREKLKLPSGLEDDT